MMITELYRATTATRDTADGFPIARPLYDGCRRLLCLVALSLCITWSLAAFAQSTHGVQQEVRQAPPVEVVEQIQSIVEDIQRLQLKLDQSTAEAVPRGQDPQDDPRAETLKALEQRQTSLEQIATGAVDLSLFETQPLAEGFDWREELEEVFEPAVLELKKITERPRSIERLRTEREAIDTRLEAATLAVQNITALQGSIETNTVSRSLDDLLEIWDSRRSNLESRLATVDFRLGELQDDGGTYKTRIAQSLQDFFTGRGLNLLIAIATFIIVYLLFHLLSQQLERIISRGQDKESRFFARLTHIIFQVATVLIAILASMLTLYLAGDWLILTILIVLVVGFVFALRNSLPRYLDEARLLLNIGPVREGERVIYRGISWNVSRINLYSTIVNPWLTGGRLRLPMSEMLTLISRRYNKREPWFPSKTDEYVLLDDDTFGTVELQTPEVVQIRTQGGASKMLPVAEYLALAPRNLSSGFGLFVGFGLDYGHQAEITSDIPSKLDAALRKRLEDSPYREWLEKLQVEFDKAAASSLDLKILAFFSGEAAGDYFRLRRLVQAIAVDACNKEGWTIPFDQITVHNAEAH